MEQWFCDTLLLVLEAHSVESVGVHVTKNNQITLELGDIFVDAKYDEELGLQLDIPEGSLFEEFSV